MPHDPDSTMMENISPLSDEQRNALNEKLHEIDIFSTYSYTEQSGRKFVCDGTDVRLTIETALEWDRAVRKRDARAFMRVSMKFLTLPMITSLILGGFVFNKLEEKLEE